ncbi:MAG: hypothetical protein FD123_3948 [Bacteroidetes bacterium]|nr:MAG: hypothetical protein FD123_3948 [Bacteroidota bacterium]
MLRLSILPIIILVAGGCSNSRNTNPPAKGEKKLVVDAAYCEKYQVREAHFSANIPEILIDEGPVEGEANPAYAYYSLVKPQEGASDSVQAEFISIGPFWNNSGGIAEESLIKSTLGQMTGYLEQAGYTFKEQQISKATFNGKEYWQLRAKGSVDNIETRMKGDYIILAVILPPEGSSPNGLFIMMGANQDSPIRSFEDFAEKGTISGIWKTIQFN